MEVTDGLKQLEEQAHEKAVSREQQGHAMPSQGKPSPMSVLL